MKGMNHATGQAIDGVAHLCQSIARILTTPLGSRIGRRDFGSELHQLVDAPNNAATRVRVFAASATALMKWEKRVKVTRIGLSNDPNVPGAQIIDIEGTTGLSRDLVTTRVTLTPSRKP